MRRVQTVGVWLAGASLLMGWQSPEALDRGLVAIPTSEGHALVSWRSLAGDADDATFELVRIRAGKEEPIALEGDGTNFLDESPGEAYRVRVMGEKEFSRPTQLLENPWLEIPIDPMDGYRAGDCSTADLDGDGELEFVVHMVGLGRDNGSAGLTTAPVLEAYKMDGTRLWRIDLGKNIREGEHYTQFMVYDLDGDGCAEVACKTADGTVDGQGKVIGDPSKDWVNQEEGTQRFGRILEGPEFLTVFDGKTGRALVTTPYVPGRGKIDEWGGRGGNGGNDSYGNRCDRFLACVAYLDGEEPSLVMCRGVYGRIVMAAWDWRGGELTQRWLFDSGVSMPPFEDASEFSGMGGHSLAVADVDADGKDEIVYQAMVVDDDGKGLMSTGRRHGDTLTVGDLDPEREGLELYLVSENENATVRWGTPGAGLHDALTGKPLWKHSPGRDISSGLVADIDPRYDGMEVWGGHTGLRTIKGEEIGREPRNWDWLVWWDGDLQREIYSAYRVLKWDWEKQVEKPIFEAELPHGGEGRRRWRGVNRWPNLTGDLIGDWREEILLAGPGGKSLRLYTTPIPSEHRVPCLMQDRQYRLAVALQNVVYNKCPQLSYYLGSRKVEAVAGAMVVPSEPEVQLE